VEEIYKTREEQIHKKQKILEELQKVCIRDQSYIGPPILSADI